MQNNGHPYATCRYTSHHLHNATLESKMISEAKQNQFFRESDEVRDTLRKFSNEKLDKHGSYAWASGFFESLLSDALMQLPKKKRAEILDRLM